MSVSIFGIVGAANGGPVSIAIDNAGFEEFGLADGRFTRTYFSNNPNLIVTPDPIPGWTLPPAPRTEANSNAGTFNPTTGRYPAGAPEGQNVAYVASASATVSQVLSAVLEGNTTYTLQVEVGDRADLGFPGYSVQLLAGGNLLAEGDNIDLSPADGTFATLVITFTAAGNDPNLGQSLEIRLNSNGQQTNFDDVRLTAVGGGDDDSEDSSDDDSSGSDDDSGSSDDDSSGSSDDDSSSD